jgi:hypothetical protein
MTDIPTPVAAADLPVTGYVSDHQLAGPWAFAVISPVERLGEDETALTPLAPAQSQLDALREEVARLTKERRQLEFAMGAWKEIFWAVARELNCLPSTFWDGNAHVLKAAIKLNAELAALKAQPSDVDALMALADKYASCKAEHEEHAPAGSLSNMIAAREALRAKLAARKEST